MAEAAGSGRSQGQGCWNESADRDLALPGGAGIDRCGDRGGADRVAGAAGRAGDALAGAGRRGALPDPGHRVGPAQAPRRQGRGADDRRADRRRRCGTHGCIGYGRRGRRPAQNLRRIACPAEGRAQAARPGRRLSLQHALVRHHRSAGRRQDHGSAEERPELPAGRPDRRKAAEGRRRHPAMRLVVRRRGDLPRHRRALHHPGQPGGGRPDRLGRLPEAAEGCALAPADQRRAGRHGGARPRRRRGGGAGAACRRHPPPPARALRDAEGQGAGLSAADQGRPDRRLQRVLPRPEPGRAAADRRHHPAGRRKRAGRRRHGDAGQRAGRHRRPAVRPRRRPHPAGAGAGAPRRDLRLSLATRLAEGTAARLRRGGLQGQPLRAGAAAARRLFHQRHPGRHPDRPADRRAGGEFRPAGGALPRRRRRRRPAAQLFPRQPAERSGVPRGQHGRLRPGGGAAAHLGAAHRLRPVRAGHGGGDRRLGRQLSRQCRSDRPRAAGGRFLPPEGGGAGRRHRRRRRHPPRPAGACRAARPAGRP